MKLRFEFRIDTPFKTANLYQYTTYKQETIGPKPVARGLVAKFRIEIGRTILRIRFSIRRLPYAMLRERSPWR